MIFGKDRSSAKAVAASDASAPVKQHAHGELIALRNPPDQHFV
jgi:hypothetical protein